jgi:hypothetical protein
MALFGLSAAFLGAAAADLRGSPETRPFTRWAFGVVAVHELELVGLAASATADVVGALGGVVG